MGCGLENVMYIFPSRIKQAISEIPKYIVDSIQEVRIRCNKPVCITDGKKFYYLGQNGELYSNYMYSNKNYYFSSFSEVKEIFNAVCEYSIYSYSTEISNGYITIKGGNRVGICGTAIFGNGRIKTLTDVSSLNIRIAREKTDVSSSVIKDIPPYSGYLVVGPPSCGKTTLLRDIARNLSNNGTNVVLVDERGELAATYHGESQMDVGINTDVLNGYNKLDGVMQAIRALSPGVVICDELGNDEDFRAINYANTAGVKIIASVHGSSCDNIYENEKINRLIRTGAFNYVVFMKGRDSPGQIQKIVEVKKDGENNWNDINCAFRNNDRLCERSVLHQQT